MILTTEVCIKAYIEFSKDETRIIEDIYETAAFKDIDSIIECLILGALGYEGVDIAAVKKGVIRIWERKSKGEG